MKSDRSQNRGITFQHGDRKETSSTQVHEERPPSPASTCLSMKSDRSQNRGITFQHGDRKETSSKMEENISHAASFQLTQIPQCNFDHILQELENKIFTFLRNELKRFKRILSPDYIEKFEHKDDDDESDAREGALKMTLHFLRTMDQKELADKLQENENGIVCRTELKKSLQNRYQSVLEGIQMQGGSALLEKIYTEVYITEGGSGKVNEEHEVRQIEMKSKLSARQETPIKCSDIFKPLPGQDKPIRRVITKGVAGIGKTVSVQKYILDWAEGKENQDIHFIFPLPFRELNLIREEQYSMMALLHHLFSEIKPLTFQSQEKRKVLFILDGLDECRPQLNFPKSHSLTDVTEVSSVDMLLTNLIKGHLFPSALVWITSRPAAANQIPPVCVDRVTEVQGFSDPQKQEYFRKRISDQNVAEGVISHIRSSRILYIMCHIPVFCWIAATVLQQVIAGGKKVPKTLTEMYTYFLVFQNRQRGLKFDDVYDEDPQWNQACLLGLGRLAYEQLEKGNLIFYEKDLKECGLDVEEAAIRSGIFTQMFQEVSGVILGKVYSFVHLSIQEYLAALYVFLMMRNKRKDLVSIEQPQASNFRLERKFPSKKQKSMIALQKSVVDKAFQCEDVRFDLFLRFLLGLSLDSNQNRLHGLLQKQHVQTDNEEIIRYIKGRIREASSSERVLNLFHCLNELNDHSLVKEIQSFLSAGTVSEAHLSPGQWSALVFVLLTSEDKLDVFDLQKYGRSYECLVRLLPVLEESQTALLNHCNLTKQSCALLASVLRKPSSKLKSLDLSGNKIGYIEVGEICNGLKTSICTLEMLNLSWCTIGEEGFRALASALRSNPSHMREVQLSWNHAGDSGVRYLSSLLEDPNCKLETLHLSNCSFGEEGFRALASALRSNPSHMRELQLSGNKAGDSGVKHLSSILEDPNCKLEKLDLSNCSFGEEGFRALVSALISNPSHMRELQLSGNRAGNSGVKHLSSLLEHPDCKLETLHLRYCCITDKCFRCLAAALRSKPSALRELRLVGNELGPSSQQLLSELQQDPNCKHIQIGI
ncbi:NLR family CARD domain-containing protein 3-like isoform X2 [Engraulis encrasicolus]